LEKKSTCKTKIIIGAAIPHTAQSWGFLAEKIMKKYFIDLYEKAVCFTAQTVATLANKALLSVIELKGLDPNLEIEAIFRKKLDGLWDKDKLHKSRYVERVPYKVPFLRGDESRNGYVMATRTAGAVPDYSNAGNENDTLKLALKELIKYADIINGQCDGYGDAKIDEHLVDKVKAKLVKNNTPEPVVIKRPASPKQVENTFRVSAQHSKDIEALVDKAVKPRPRKKSTKTNKKKSKKNLKK
jgi:hypothetical protein